MLRRKMLGALLSWKAGHGQECLLVNGARQVGKSYIVDRFGEGYANYVKLDFVEHPEYRGIFAGALSAEAIWSNISLYVPGARLVGSEMALRCRSVSTAAYPLAAYEDEGRFRLYANDTGLLMAMYDFGMKRSVVEGELSGPMKGGLYENLVAVMLAANSRPLRYWMSRDGSREIEFLAEAGGKVVPIEVKASRNKSVSLDAFLERDDVARGYKLVDGNVGIAGKKVTLPHYLTMCI